MPTPDQPAAGSWHRAATGRGGRALMTVAGTVLAAGLVTVTSGVLGRAPGATSPATAPPPTSAGVPEVAASGQPPPCPAGGCVTLDATSAIGPVDHAGSGFNLLPGPYDASGQMRSLGATMYRSAPSPRPSGGYDWGNWAAAVRSGARTTLVLSDLWYDTGGGQPPATPWSDWPRYASWVRSTVQEVLASGERVDYWDVYNEPGWHGYYTSSDFAAETPDDLLQQFLVTYRAIRSVDPTAAIVGPSTGDWSLTPLGLNPVTHEPDMTTFLDFAAAHHLQLAAVAWHHNGESPATIYTEAEATWNLIHSLPALGHPLMFLDEYGWAPVQPIPGFDVGYLETVARAHIASAERSCWGDCSMAGLDGLLIDGGRDHTADYFVRTTYAQMSGQTIRSTTSEEDLSALGAFDPATRRLVALIGRHEGCALPAWCRTGWVDHGVPPTSPTGDNPVPPADVEVTFTLPWRAARPVIHLSYEAFQPGVAVAGPQPARITGLIESPAGPGRTQLTFTIPGFADGSAYNLIVTPGN